MPIHSSIHSENAGICTVPCIQTSTLSRACHAKCTCTRISCLSYITLNLASSCLGHLLTELSQHSKRHSSLRLLLPTTYCSARERVNQKLCLAFHRAMPDTACAQRLKPQVCTTVRYCENCENAGARTVPAIQSFTLSHASHVEGTYGLIS